MYLMLNLPIYPILSRILGILLSDTAIIRTKENKQKSRIRIHKRPTTFFLTDDTNEGIKRVNYKYIKNVAALYNPPKQTTPALHHSRSHL